MRTLLSIGFLLITLITFGQKSIRKSYILVDGKHTTYKEYKKIDLTKFKEIKILPANGETNKIFGKKANGGILHLKTSSFIENQKMLLSRLKKEFENNNLEMILLVINGVPLNSSNLTVETMNKINSETVEVISTSDNTTTFNHNNKTVIVILTNKTIPNL